MDVERMPTVIMGGTGFIGRRLVERLVSRGRPVRVVSRRADDGGVRSALIERMTAAIEDQTRIERVVANAWAVVNLVGTTAARSEHAFHAVHCEAPALLAQASRRAGAVRFVHVSAMGIGPEAPAAADRSKAAGENAVRASFPDATFARPALVYGPDDHFFTRFVPLVRRAPALPLIGGGHTRFQPMHVDDVAATLARILDEPDAAGRTFELGAAEVFTFRELIERLCRALGRRPWLVPVPFAVAEAGARLMQWLPGAPLTLDQVRLLKTDKVIRDPQRGPEALGVRPRALDGFLQTLARRT